MSNRKDIQGDLMRWLATGPATDTPTLAKVMGVETSNIANAVRRLNEKGYVSFRLKPGDHGGRPQFTDIRLTPEGSRNIPDPIAHAETGSKWSHTLPPKHPGDRTDYRTHGSHAEGTKPVRTVEVREQPITIRKVETLPSGLPAASPDPRHPEPTRIGATYPILESIRNRVRATEPLQRAASALPKGDPLRRNIEARIDNDLNQLGQIEQEYLAYAKAHRDDQP